MIYVVCPTINKEIEIEEIRLKQYELKGCEQSFSLLSPKGGPEVVTRSQLEYAKEKGYILNPSAGKQKIIDSSEYQSDIEARFEGRLTKHEMYGVSFLLCGFVICGFIIIKLINGVKKKMSKSKPDQEPQRNTIKDFEMQQQLENDLIRERNERLGYK